MKKSFQAYRCPNCNLRLNVSQKTLRCDNGHSFDIAKEGYVNLILANRKKSLNSGDNKEMILSRDKFLKHGYFDFLVKTICNLKILENEVCTILEIGCGSGFYLNKIATKTNSREVYGSDVSKEAIKFCSKKYKDYSFSVNNSFNLCFENSYFDIILSIFSPFKNSEIERLLSENGYFILVRPNQGHLNELYRLSGMKFKEKISPDFKNLRLIGSFDLMKTQQITVQHLRLLIQMSPLVWKLHKIDSFIDSIPEITFDLKFNVYKRK